MELSVLIPSRNRAKYLESVVFSLLESEGDFEIIVMDNSDVVNKTLSSIHNSRLRYSYTSEVVSFVDNFNRAVRLAKGDWLIAIGDDDFCNVSAILSAIQNTQCMALIYPLEKHFFWLDNDRIEVRYWKDKRAPLEYEVNKEWEKYITSNDVDYIRYHLPRLYHGVVRRSAVLSFERAKGHLAMGYSPDISYVALLSKMIDRVEYIDLQLSYPGVCTSSGSYQSMVGSHQGDLNKMPHLRGKNGLTWTPDLVRYYSVETVWVQTILETVELSSVQKRYFILKTNACVEQKYFSKKKGVGILPFLKRMVLTYSGNHRVFNIVSLRELL